MNSLELEDQLTAELAKRCEGLPERDYRRLAERIAERYTPPKSGHHSQWQVRSGVQLTDLGQPTIYYVERHDESVEVYRDEVPDRRSICDAVAGALNAIEGSRHPPAGEVRELERGS